MTDAPLAVLLVGDYPADPTLGSAKVMFKLQEHLRALGHCCETMFADEIGGPQSRQLRQLVSPWRAGSAIERRVRTGAFDVVDAASAEGLGVGVRRRIWSRSRAAYVCRSHGLEHLNYRRMLDDARAGITSKPWTRRVWYPVSRLSQVAAAARTADAMIVLNDRDREFVLQRGWQPADRVSVVPHGVSERFLRDDASPHGPRGAGLLFCGSWDHIKGIHYLVGAFEQLHALGRRFRLTVLGPGVPTEIVLRAFTEAVRPFVTVLPRVAEAEVIAAFRAHDLLLWTSTYEGFGLVLLEAMTQRLPVVSTAVGCAATLVRDGQTGVLIPARDAAAIASAVVRLMEDRDLRSRLASAARAMVDGMTWDRTARLTVDVYRCALANVRGG